MFWGKTNTPKHALYSKGQTCGCTYLYNFPLMYRSCIIYLGTHEWFATKDHVPARLCNASMCGVGLQTWTCVFHKCFVVHCDLVHLWYRWIKKHRDTCSCREHITNSDVATIKYHMHYPIFMACTGAAGISLKSYPYTVWTQVSYQGVSALNNLGMRLWQSKLLARYHIAGNFWRRKLSRISRFEPVRESFLCEIWGMVSFGAARTSSPRKFSLLKSYFSPICESFLPRKFPAIRYPLPFMPYT